MCQVSDNHRVNLFTVLLCKTYLQFSYLPISYFSNLVPDIFFTLETGNHAVFNELINYI